MGSCFGHISNFQGNSSRNPVIHMSTFNARTNKVELKFLLMEPQYLEGSVPFPTSSSGTPFIQRARSLLSWEHLKTSRWKLRKLVLRRAETLDLRDLKPEMNLSKDAILTLDAKQLLKVKAGMLSNRYLMLDSPQSSLDLEWENEGLSATSCVQSDYTATQATISSNEPSSNLSDRSSIESLEWDLCLNHYSDSAYNGKSHVTELQDFSLRTLKDSNNER